MKYIFSEINRDELVDISTVRIDPELPVRQRIREYIRQVRNPYCFLSNGIIVQITFSKTETRLEDQFTAYLKRMAWPLNTVHEPMTARKAPCCNGNSGMVSQSTEPVSEEFL